MPLINGNNGPFNPQNAIGKGLNAGFNVANAARTNPAMLDQSDIQYTTQENGKFSIDGALAYSRESMKFVDINRDGVVSTQEGGPIAQIIDINGDGKVSNAENTAYTMYQDAAGTMDGVATSQERRKADQAMMADPNTARAQMQKLLQGHNLEQRDQQLDQKLQQGAQNGQQGGMPQQMMQQMMQLIGMFMQSLMSILPMLMGGQQKPQNGQQMF